MHASNNSGVSFGTYCSGSCCVKKTLMMGEDVRSQDLENEL